MAKIPESFSLQAVPITAALSEGRTEDARTLIVDLLRSGTADRVVQGLAANMLKPAKRGRGRQKALPHHWIAIAEEFHDLRDKGVKYEEAIAFVEKKFGYSETHIRNSVFAYDRTRDDDEPDRN